jgi:hypothetical protein
MNMATFTMAQAVLDHANDHYNDGRWYMIAECWDAPSIEEELDRQEEITGKPFSFEAEAISHFSQMIHGGFGKRRRH